MWPPSGRWITVVASVLHPRAQLPHRPFDRDGGSIDGGEMLADTVSDHRMRVDRLEAAGISDMMVGEATTAIILLSP